MQKKKKMLYETKREGKKILIEPSENWTNYFDI